MTTASIPDIDTVATSASDWLNASGSWLLNDGKDWTIWIAIAAGLFLGLRFLRALIAGTIKSGDHPDHAARNVAGRMIANTKQIFLLVLSFGLTAPFLVTFPEGRETILPRILMVITIIQVVIWLRILVMGIVDGSLAHGTTDPRSAASLRSLFRLFVNIGLAAIAGIMILNNLGMDASALIAGLGVGGIAIGLAAQSIFQDLFAGMSIMLDRPFVRGDFISFKGFSGTVEKVGLKTTRLKALAGEQLVVTNASLLSNEIQNYKVMRERRIVFRVGVTYQTPHATLAALPEKIEAAIRSRPRCRFDRCHLADYGDSAILFECVYYILSPEYLDYMDEQQAIYLEVHRMFEEMSVEFAYPTQTVFLEKS